MTQFVRRAIGTVTACGLLLAAGGVFAQDKGEAPPEHLVVKPMTGAVLDQARSRVDDFGTMPVSVVRDGRTVRDTAEGRFWHLEYQLEDRATSRDEIMSNYASEVARIGGEVLERSATRLRFRIVAPGGATTWGILDARAGGRYELELLDEAGLDLSLEFDEDAMLEALTRDGRVSIYGILFDVDRVDLLPGSGEVLDTVAAVLKANPEMRLEVQGHTDSTGSAERNRQLSLERAQRVAGALALYGVDPARLEPRGFGPDRPVADNATDEGRRQNRRVELVRTN